MARQQLPIFLIKLAFGSWNITTDSATDHSKRIPEHPKHKCKKASESLVNFSIQCYLDAAAQRTLYLTTNRLRGIFSQTPGSTEAASMIMLATEGTWLSTSFPMDIHPSNYYNLVLFPIFTTGHFSLLALFPRSPDMQIRSIYHYDSLKPHHTRVAEEFLGDLKRYKIISRNVSIFHVSVPQQPAGKLCGFYTIQNAKILIERASLGARDRPYILDTTYEGEKKAKEEVLRTREDLRIFFKKLFEVSQIWETRTTFDKDILVHDGNRDIIQQDLAALWLLSGKEDKESLLPLLQHELERLRSQNPGSTIRMHIQFKNGKQRKLELTVYPHNIKYVVGEKAFERGIDVKEVEKRIIREKKSETIIIRDKNGNDAVDCTRISLSGIKSYVTRKCYATTSKDIVLQRAILLTVARFMTQEDRLPTQEEWNAIQGITVHYQNLNVLSWIVSKRTVAQIICDFTRASSLTFRVSCTHPVLEALSKGEWYGKKLRFGFHSELSSCILHPLAAYNDELTMSMEKNNRKLLFTYRLIADIALFSPEQIQTLVSRWGIFPQRGIIEVPENPPYEDAQLSKYFTTEITPSGIPDELRVSRDPPMTLIRATRNLVLRPNLRKFNQQQPKQTIAHLGKKAWKDTFELSSKAGTSRTNFIRELLQTKADNGQLFELFNHTPHTFDVNQIPSLLYEEGKDGKVYREKVMDYLLPRDSKFMSVTKRQTFKSKNNSVKNVFIALYNYAVWYSSLPDHFYLYPCILVFESSGIFLPTYADILLRLRLTDEDVNNPIWSTILTKSFKRGDFNLSTMRLRITVPSRWKKQESIIKQYVEVLTRRLSQANPFQSHILVEAEIRSSLLKKSMGQLQTLYKKSREAGI